MIPLDREGRGVGYQVVNIGEAGPTPPAQSALVESTLAQKTHVFDSKIPKKGG